MSSRKHFSLCVLSLALALLSAPARADEWRVQIGLSYLNNFDDLVDRYEDNLDAELRAAGFWVIRDDDTEGLPIGLSIHPYYQYDNGLRLGGGVGPAAIIYGDVDHFQLPLCLDVGYTLAPSAPTTPYVRTGLSYHVADGDYVEDSKLGFIAGVGIELFRNKDLAFGVEAAYDSAETEIEIWGTRQTDDIKVAEFSIRGFIVF